MTDITDDNERALALSPQADEVTPTAARKPWARRLIVVAAALVLLGAAFRIGEASAISAQRKLSETRSQLSATRGELDRTRNQLSSTRGALTSEQAKVQVAQASAAQANARAQAKYTAAEAKLASETKTLNTLVGRIQASAISSDGVYVVGHDIKPGTWHTSGDGGQGGSACYFATLNSLNTSDIIDNNNFDGPETVSVSGAYAFEISGPCTWYRTGP
jgi:hypothetical protein